LDDNDRKSDEAAVKKFVVAQIGARRGYAVPAILEKAGMLERFYTNITGDIDLGKFFSAAAVLPFLGKPARRLAGRRLPSNIRAKTTTFPCLTLMHMLRRAFIKRNPVASFRGAMRFSNALGRAMARQGFGNATHIYSMLGECGPLLATAKERGLTVVSEVYIPLSTERILAEERKKFPDWEANVPDFSAIRRKLGVEDALLKFSDYFICPSEMAQEDLIANWGIQRERTALVPYGINPELLSVRNDPVRGRVLFAGTAELRKGIHYFAMAAEKLVARGRCYEFRVAGNVQRSVANQKHCRYLTFLGRVPRADMTREFAAADLFVMPSLAETGPEVNYEALACGVPVVTTSEARAIVRDGIEGRIVPARDPDVLADAIIEIIEDREKRDRMARASRERARDFTWACYGERLVSALKSFDRVENDSIGT
jgi:glycosyltransferase involved in cell wall biosynthesis